MKSPEAKINLTFWVVALVAVGSIVAFSGTFATVQASWTRLGYNPLLVWAALTLGLLTGLVFITLVIIVPFGIWLAERFKAFATFCRNVALFFSELFSLPSSLWLQRRFRREMRFSLNVDEERPQTQAEFQRLALKRLEELTDLKNEHDRLLVLFAEAHERIEELETATTGSSTKPNTREWAIELLGLSPTFTQADLKKRRSELLKKIHPDHGGSNAMARMVNEAFELLT